jgi:sulfoxide reductase heme-binding subunit YedZ
MQLFPKRDAISGISIGTAYAALLLMGTTLALGPWNVLRGRANPVSFHLRRDLGIWAGIAALVHTAVGLNVHLRGKPWLYFVDQNHRLRTGIFGFANYTGLIAALAFALLLVVSNDVSLRRLGAVKWKSIQRWTYAAAVLTAAHAVAFQNVEKRILRFRLLVYAVLAAIFLLQVAGVIRRRRPRKTDPERLRELVAQPADSSLRSE